jgi:hypothetical protein
MTQEEYDALLQAQEGKCKICGAPPTAVDHDHETGEVRGLLCRACNLGLGYFKDSAELLQRAIAYLEEAESVRSAGQPVVISSEREQL